MVNIAKKKLPTAAISVIVYLSYCAMSWFSMRGTLAYLGQQYGIGGWFANDAWAFFLGGLIPFLLYEVFTSFVFKMTAARAGGDIKSLQYIAQEFLFLNQDHPLMLHLEEDTIILRNN